MAFRGRGRGRGGFGGAFRNARQEPFELFPEITELGTAVAVGKEDRKLAILYYQFHRVKTSSPYYLDDENEAPGKTQSTDIERYADRKSGKTGRKPPLSDFIRMEPDYLPAELAKGEKKVKRGSKRAKWNPDADMKKLDIFEKLEHKYQGQGENEQKGEEEEDEDENVEEDEEEYSDDGDYNQNRDFDDDEDDFNMADDNDDEPMF